MKIQVYKLISQTMKHLILLISILLITVANASEVVVTDNEKISEVVAPVKKEVVPLVSEAKVAIPQKTIEKPVVIATRKESLILYFILVTVILVGILVLASIIPLRSRKK